MGNWKYLIIFLVLFILAYLFYYFLAIRPQVRIINGKKRGRPSKKEKDLPTEVKLLRDYYKIDIEKIGLLRVLRIVNFVNALLLSSLTMLVFPFKALWLKLIILALLIVPSIWFTYYFLAKYLKYLERKSD